MTRFFANVFRSVIQSGALKMTDMKMTTSKLQGMKLQDMKLQDMTRIDSILLNFSFFSCIVMLTLQQWNCVM